MTKNEIPDWVTYPETDAHGPGAPHSGVFAFRLSLCLGSNGRPRWFAGRVWRKVMTG